MFARIAFGFLIAWAGAAPKRALPFSHASGPAGLLEDPPDLVESLLEEDTDVVALDGSSGGVSHVKVCRRNSVQAAFAQTFAERKAAKTRAMEDSAKLEEEMRQAEALDVEVLQGNLNAWETGAEINTTPRALSKNPAITTLQP